MLPGLDRLHDTPPDKVMWLQVFGRLKPGVTLAQAETPGQRDLPGRTAIVLRRARVRRPPRRLSRSAAAAASRRAWRFVVAGRTLRLADGAAGRRWRAAADRVREPRQPAARARRRAPIRRSRCACRSARAANASCASSSPKAWRWRPWAASPPSPSPTCCTAHWSACWRNPIPDFRVGFALDPRVVGVPRRGDRGRGAAVRRAAGLAGDQNRRRGGAQGTDARRHRLAAADAFGTAAREPAAGAVGALAGGRGIAGADRLQPAARRSRLPVPTAAAGACRFPRGRDTTTRAARPCFAS